MNIKNVAVIGSKGQVGKPLTKSLIKLNHKVTIIVRNQEAVSHPIIKEQVSMGAILKVCEDMKNIDELSAILKGCDTLVCCVPGSKEIITEYEPIWLKAAIKAEVKRFVPTEFGAHTEALDYGDGEIFDNKKDFHKILFNSDIGWTLFYNGGFFDYFLPNLRFFQEITTFGKMDIPIYTHDIEDAAYIAAMAITDERTLNKCVQMDYNYLTQNEMLEILNKYWSDYPFVYKHYSSAYISKMKNESGDLVTAKRGAETDKERWGINEVIYVKNKLVSFNENTLKASKLWPSYKCKTPEEAIKDPNFVFEFK